MSPEWTVLSAERFDLGEGLRSVSGGLVMTDILSGRLLSVDTGEVLVSLDEPLGAVAPLAGGGWIAAAGRGMAVLDGGVRWLARPVDASMRMNDGVADASGRFWAGAMAWDARPGAGRLFRVDPDGSVHTVLEGLTVPNGPVFAGDTMYLADSAAGVIHRYEVSEAGEPGPGELFARVSEGSPDGMTVDAEGYVWSAIWGASRVVRFAPDGTVDRVLPVPAVQPTSVCLAGGRLIVTSATHGLAAPGPLDGAVLATPCSVTAAPACAARVRPGLPTVRLGKTITPEDVRSLDD
ncbi:SMP-30/gluconolactonase/LRE family protein [Amycolatopsis tucumanensis]|uniref:SMP-30/gluconolactonase/LRE family protein n=1 Tax=Amycolatopsis tucumanensis TaxID=401106 RepID=UPI003D719F75